MERGFVGGDMNASELTDRSAAYKPLRGNSVEGQNRNLPLPPFRSSGMLDRSLLIALPLAATLYATHAVAQTAPPTTAPAEAATSPSGIASIILTAPSIDERSPGSDDHVTLDYTTWTADGLVIDSTDKHPDVRTFQLSKLSSGLQESVSAMKRGEKRRLWIPAAMGPKKMAVIIDVELLAISRPFDAPADVAAPPADAERTKNGIASKVLVAGAGTSHPKHNSFVVVHYSGWTTDGTMFDSSFKTGEPGYFRLTEVIPGWRDGIQLMVAGEKRRFWIPEKLAYRGERGMPRGMLVFDVELIRFH
jgi:FKBP-type peptidyl-prolyl cis-trans isomerase